MKNTIKIKINTTVSLTIFDEPNIRKRLFELFDEMAEELKSRINEILEFLYEDTNVCKKSDELSYNNILKLFRIHFYKSILYSAIEMVFSEQRQFNMMNNILSLLTADNLADAIYGKVMIDAFSDALRSIPSDGGLVPFPCGGKIMLLEKKFLGIDTPY